MTIENTHPEISAPVAESKPGCLGQLGWFFSGAVLPMGSLSYYRTAARRSVGSAILFFVMFTLTISTLVTINMGINLLSGITSIREAFANGEIPAITISNGVAEVDGPQPYIFVNGYDGNGRRVFLAIDTSGEITEIDTSRYDQGVLITKTEFHVYDPSQGGYQTLPLSEFNTMFEQDPIVINADTISQAWVLLSAFMVVFGFIGIVLWYTVIRLMIIAVMALIAWGLVALFKPGAEFGPVIITGLYAIVPAIYLSHLFSRTEISFPGLQTFFLVVFWSIGLVGVFGNLKTLTAEKPPRLWTALLGLPMILLFIVDMFWQIPSPYGVISLWAVSILTSLALIGLRLFFRFQAPQTTEPIS